MWSNVRIRIGEWQTEKGISGLNLKGGSRGKRIQEKIVWIKENNLESKKKYEKVC